MWLLQLTTLRPPSLQVRSHGARAMGLLRRGGPAPRWRARSLEAGLLRLRAAHARTSACGEWGGGGSPPFPARHAPCAHARAEEGTRAEGRNGAPRRRAHRLAHVPLLPRAMCGRQAMTHARAAPAAPATGDFCRPHRPPRLSGASRSPTNPRGFRREHFFHPPLYVRGQDHARTI